MKLASQGLYLGDQERRREVPEKKTVYLGWKNNNGKSNEVVPLWGLSVILFHSVKDVK